jgi:hypothetical protein
MSIVPLPRKIAYQTFFNVSQVSEIQGVYQWHQDLSAEAFLILCDFEVIFRSRVHEAISQLYCTQGGNDWILNASSRANLISQLQSDMTTAQANGNELYINHSNIGNYNLNSRFSLTKQDRVGFVKIIIDFLNRGKINFTHDDLISAVSFGFWVSLIKLIKNKRNGALIHSHLLAIFPYSNKAFDVNHIDGVLDTLYRIKSFRNRIGHHDSIMRIPEPNPGHLDFYPRNLIQMIKSLEILMKSLLELVRDIDPAYANTLENSKNWKSFFLLLKQNTYLIYKNNKGSLDCYVMAYISNLYS